MDVAASATSSPAIGPTMCTPSTRSVFSCARIFTRPSISAIARARLLALKWKTPFR